MSTDNKQISELITNDHSICVGCNRCIRVCPVEGANIAYNDGDDIKVKTNYDHCIACGACISTCRHDSRDYYDDTERFLSDLINGVPVSVLASPASRVSAVKQGRLFTWLRKQGVKKIYDASLGADICTWAHIRFIERDAPASVITQPCPAVVNYILTHEHSLLPYLSPVHSPMLCTAIYMRDHDGINDKIAALSPCIAKKHEFEETGYVEYNVTLKKIFKYIKDNNVELPEQESGFDHPEASFGRLYSMPGGLSENLELYFGKTLRIDRLGGQGTVYASLSAFAKKHGKHLPAVFDVLNCADGCNVGTGCDNGLDIFQINDIMDSARQSMISGGDTNDAGVLYDGFDRKLDLNSFIRKYDPRVISQYTVTDDQIEDAFKQLRKETESDRKFDCSACGSDTCFEMAKRIACGLNIPSNCIQKEHSELRSTTVYMRSALKSAEISNQAKSSFLATMSHEIRTPINAIIGIAQIELQKEAVRGDYALAMERIFNSGNSLLGIINDILDMSKIETGKLELYPVDYDTASFINDTVHLNLVRFGTKPVEFILDVEESLPAKLYGDELRLKQILNNLLSNAIKYTDKGFVKLSVRHTPEEDGDISLSLTVEDTGQGMRSEDRQKFFAEYQRFNAEANRNAEGTGLGLSITKSLVDLMNGTIRADSEYGKGSVFCVTIRQKAVQAGVIGAETAERLCSFTFVSKRQADKLQITRDHMPYGRVLVVDDVETNLFVTEGLLIPYELNIDTTDNGFDAVSKIADGNVYDIIFMDHMMPHMDGIKTARKIRELGYTGIITALTANTLVGNEEMFLANGFDAFISKPIDIHLLNSILNKFVRDAHPEEAMKYKPEIVNQVLSGAADLRVRKAFCSDAGKAIITLREAIASNDINLFTMTAHSMKSALVNINETDASVRALELENAGYNNDMDHINVNINGFIKLLERLIKSLTPEEIVADDSGIIEDTVYLTEQLQMIGAACEVYDDDAAYAVLDRLNEKQWSSKTADLLERIHYTLFIYSDFDGASEMISQFLG